jgi:hypothetical protein
MAVLIAKIEARSSVRLNQLAFDADVERQEMIAPCRKRFMSDRQAVIVTAAMDEATRSAWCREQGLYPAELDGWKQDAVAGLGEPRAASAAEAREDRRRVKELERQLHRKDKALAEEDL